MRILFVLTFFLFFVYTYSRDIVKFSVSPVEGAGVSAVAVPLDGIDFNNDDHQLVLYKKGSDGLEIIASQLEAGTRAVLWFLFDNSDGEVEYLLRREVNEAGTKGVLRIEQSGGYTTIMDDGSPVLRYHHTEFMPPDGVDPVFRRSAFIHPLWSPSGEVLTRIQPEDHYHHYGIWNPWTRTVIDSQYVDFWNLGGGQGRVRSAGYLGIVEGQVFTGFRVHQEHVAYMDEGTDNETLALNELWDVRVWDTGHDAIKILDLATTLNTPLENGILFEAYRYGGGIGFRATEKWHAHNSTALSSEGKTRDEIDGTGARWVIVEGESSVAEGRSGILFLSHPGNRMHPEPVRMWGTGHNQGMENVFMNFCPIRHDDWMIEPGRNYTLRYRMVVFDGTMEPDEAETFWRSFAVAPRVTMTGL
ncbi:MAG: PmoA family protein [Bacteroidales bacterium]